MISFENARKWSKEAADSKLEKLLDKWIIKIGDDWVQTFRDRMSMAMIEAIAIGEYEASIEIHSPKYCPELEQLLQEYEALGFRDGASECEGCEDNTWFEASYHVSIDWGFRKLRPGLTRVRYA